MGQLSQAEKAKFTTYAQMVYPREACGLIVLRGRKAVFIPVENVSEDGDQFVMNADQQREIEETEKVIGVIHSHPDCPAARASDHDVAACRFSGVPWTIITVPGGDEVTIQPDTTPLLGRPFILGLNDCWGLMIDWHRKYGVELVDPRLHPDHHWWESGEEERYTEATLLAAGFEMQEKPTVGSMVVMQVSAPVANHAGVILPDGQMLHHLYGQLSSRTPYGGYYRDRTWYICRHKDLPPESEIMPC